MRHHRTIRMAALFALLVSALAPRADVVWQCEGRTCGTTPWFCCCVSPTGARDANCGTITGAASGAAVCPTTCNCTLTIEAVEAARPTVPHRFSPPVRHPALLAHAAVAAVTLPKEIALRVIETRGPPLSPRVLATPSLRAPPVA